MKNLSFFTYIKTVLLTLMVGSASVLSAQKQLMINNQNVKINKVGKELETLLEHANEMSPVQIYVKLNKGHLDTRNIGKEIVVGDFLGGDWVALKITKALSQKQLEQLFKVWAAVNPQMKTSDYFDHPTSSLERVIISLFKGTDTSTLRQEMVNAKATWEKVQKWSAQDKWLVNIELSKLPILAANPNVLFVSPSFEDQSLEDPAIAIANGSNALLSANGLGLSGEGVVLGVGDDSYPNHVDYNDRVNNFNPIIQTQHGIFTTGIMAGAGIINEKIRGMAPKAQIVSNFFSNIIAYARDYVDNFNMKVTNNSYAAIVGNCNYAGTYDVVSQFVDELAIDRPELLNVFAAGNDGYMTCSPFPQRYATVVGSYQASKNALVVGLIGKNSDLVNNNGSKGPVKDGRLKPEIVAVGHQNTSTTVNNSYTSGSGTSYACPNVAGAAGVLQQRYKQKFGNLYPSSALLKAIMMNSADDLGTAGPDYANGFGNLNIGGSIEIIDSSRFFVGSLNHLANQNHVINVPANLGQLKVMVYWNDVAASPASAKALINDIDMNVSAPGGGTVLPLVLNPDPVHVLDPAVPGVDHLNNVEQVVINNPQSGNYTVNLSGFNIPSGTQDYVVVYSFVKNDIEIVYPTKDVSVEAGVATDIHWQALGNSGSFSVEWSTDNGSTWNTLGTVAANKRYFTMTAPLNTASDQCKVRVSRTAQTTTTEAFSIIQRPVITLASNQCPGNISINWNSIAGVNKYYIYKKEGAVMALVDSTTSTTYTYSGLNYNTNYWVAVAAVVGGGRSYRSLALSRIPNNGNCTGISQHGDLAITDLTLLGSGRKNTTTSFVGNTTVPLIVRNYDYVSNNNYKVNYRVNNGVWQSYTGANPIPAAGLTVTNIPGFNFTAIGTYNVEAVIQNMAISDPIAANDTFVFTIKHLANDPIILATPHVENFEAMPVITAQQNSIGLDNADRFDFENTKPDGRLRSYLQNDLTLDGTRSISLDNSLNHVAAPSASSLNNLIGTFNLSNYNVSNDEVRLEFDYRLHGVPQFYGENRVYVRGSDQNTWIALNTFDTNDIGTVKKYGAVSLRDALVANGQSFGSSTQIKIAQRDVSLIGGADFGSGLTVDNITLFKAENDIALVKVNNIKKFNCALGNNIPLSVDVANTMIQSQSNIPIHYQIDNQPMVSETISGIAAKDTITYVFNQTMDLSQSGIHTIKIWTDFPGDNYSYNDTLKNIEIHNQPVISSFPYLEGFEQNDGYYFSEGVNDSWEYGMPSGGSVNHAANGKKVWKTSLSGAYNPYEKSMLYSPCFDITSLANPMLSFSFLVEIEDPNGGDVFDSAFVEYSTDGGLNWSKLGTQGQGYNWYNHANNSWVGTPNNFWHVASIPLPKSSNLALRWVMHSDPGAEFAGLAIDDIHIFDYQKPIFDADSFAVAPSGLVNSITNYESNGAISGILNPLSQNLGTLSFQSYKQSGYISPDSQQFYLPRSFVVQPSNVLFSPFQLQLFVKDSLMKVVREANNCNACTSHPREVYQLGVTSYVDMDSNVINKSLVDDTSGFFEFLPKDSVLWVPYYDGYYARFNTKNIGEYWFNDGGITNSNPLPLNALDFEVQKKANRTVEVKWLNKLDLKVDKYQLQIDMGSGFQEVTTLSSINDSNHQYQYADTPKLLQQPFVFYRLKYTLFDGRVFYGPMRKISWDNLPSSFDVYPNPTNDGIINLKWYNTDEGEVSWALYSVIGHQLASGTMDQRKFSGVEQISFKNKAKTGEMYILKIKFKEKEQQYKILYLQK